MDIFVTRVFERNLRKAGIEDSKLCKAAGEIVRGLFEADLGGNVFKKRIPLASGKSGGARSVVAFKAGNNLFFVNGWTKKSVAGGGHKEISDAALAGYRDAAAQFLAFTAQNIKDAIQKGLLREVKCDGEPS
ncbi:type II toxin-antitoxin system RelE/ParE family toxin [Erwinia sp. MMLR14_017]|uniref:type II toxin-antitoxin system RelE/ParE family toxin n=1 Tax=Erwinia sp. MMLR14_017 TaxID=3093842 RepID=UPI002990204C|nr:type II toxin-antitoxin system RelE/ParE family toxin [Erwinia sp. MMLR14_017]MDW8845503.1 type II toxin-antitoxin system RelE/ParE family toxin [Erwinia sp. MMLR14_017]